MRPLPVLYAPFTVYRMRQSGVVVRGFTKKDMEALRASGAFDAKWYLETYPDVKALGMD